jgi:hypothetical protein
VEMEELHERVAGVKDGRAIEAELLSQSVRGIFDALVDLNVFPIRAFLCNHGRPGCPSSVRSHPGAAAGGACLQLSFTSLTLGSSGVTIASGPPRLLFLSPFFLFLACT